jgi:hypothetical protein
MRSEMLSVVFMQKRECDHAKWNLYVQYREMIVGNMRWNCVNFVSKTRLYLKQDKKGLSGESETRAPKKIKQ